MRTKPEYRDEADTREPQIHPPAAFTMEDAVQYSGLNRFRIYEEIGAGKIEARKAGRRTIVIGDSLRAYLANLPRANIRMGKKAA